MTFLFEGVYASVMNIVHRDISTYTKAQTGEDRAICELLMKEINRHLPEAESKIWHGHPVWFLEGNPIVTIGNIKRKLKKGDEISIKKGEKHRIANYGKALVRFLEISFGDFDEKDIRRYEDKYGRI